MRHAFCLDRIYRVSMLIIQRVGRDLWGITCSLRYDRMSFDLINISSCVPDIYEETLHSHHIHAKTLKLLNDRIVKYLVWDYKAVCIFDEVVQGLASR